jgi:hypothetical protein
VRRWKRPALQHLLADIGQGLFDAVVVYKLDRLMRSLANFATMVEIFDAHRGSFPAVTQQLNITASMGRLTVRGICTCGLCSTGATASDYRANPAGRRNSSSVSNHHYQHVDRSDERIDDLQPGPGIEKSSSSHYSESTTVTPSN